MLKRHGVQIDSPTEARWNLGVWKVFDPWVNPSLQLLQGQTVPNATRPVAIEFHFRRVVIRLVRSLALLDRCCRDWDQFLEAGGIAGNQPEQVFTIPEEGGIAADSVFHYLNLFVDDLARVIPHVLAFGESKTPEPESFSNLKSQLKKGTLKASASLRELFVELDLDDSWWNAGFGRGKGIRQRLTHYTHMVLFEGSAKCGNSQMTGDITLISIGGGVQLPDFEGSLRGFLRKLCDWLDQLDVVLLGHLCEKLAAKGVFWDPLSEKCPGVTLQSRDGIPRGASHFLYLPVDADM